MNAEPDLFQFGYPHSPAYRVGSDTSFAAAESVDAKTLQRLVLTELRKGPGTPDEVAQRLGIDKLSIRPRCSELKALGRVIDTGERRKNSNGKSAAVLKAA